MYLSLRKLVAILGALMLCSCSFTASWTAPTEPVDGGMGPSQPSSMPNPNISTLTLQCTNYVETTWGGGPGEFGLCPTSSEEMSRPDTPVLNAQGDLFILDRVNQRILKYSRSTTSWTIPIPSSYVLRDPCSYSTRGLSNLGTYGDRLFLHFPAYRGERLVEHLAVLSPEGKEEQVISLEAYHPTYPRSAPVADGNGGTYLLLPLLGILYVDASFRPEFIGTGADEMDSGGLVVGWDGNLYTYSGGYDHLTNWGAGNDLIRRGAEPISSKTDVISATRVASSTMRRLLGVDAQGQLYFVLETHERSTIGYQFVRLSASGDVITIATVPDGILDDEGLPSFNLAPDGSLYGMSYGLAEPNPSVNPRVIKCVFG